MKAYIGQHAATLMKKMGLRAVSQALNHGPSPATRSILSAAPMKVSGQRH
jgi:hypothetical protein